MYLAMVAQYPPHTWYDLERRPLCMYVCMYGSHSHDKVGHYYTLISQYHTREILSPLTVKSQSGLALSKPVYRSNPQSICTCPYLKLQRRHQVPLLLDYDAVDYPIL